MLKRSFITLLTALCLLILTGTVYAIPLPPTGTTTAENALIIGGAGEFIGEGGVLVLPSGNLVIASPAWNGGRGAVTCLTPDEYRSGNPTITAENSLTGSSTTHRVGGSLVQLANGNYVVRSSFWDNGATANVGAVTWVNGTTCIPYNETSRGAVVSQSNSVVGSTADDRIGNEGIDTFPNGSFVIISSEWDNGGVGNAGALTWVNGATGMSGAVSPTNSLVGSIASEKIGGTATTRKFPLSNGNKLYMFANWTNPTTGASAAGAVVFMSSTAGVTGAISPTTALVGSSLNDRVGENSTIAPLSDGDYVVRTLSWDNGAIVDAGAVTWCSGKTGCQGTVSAANSLVGSQTNDRVGLGVTVLTNGAFVVGSQFWDNGSVVDAGAVTWGDGTKPLKGVISSANSLIGTQTNQRVGSGGIQKLTQGGYTVSTPLWDNGAIEDVGAVRWSNGLAPLTGQITAQNSIIGASAGDQVGTVTPLTNGHYIVTAESWDNGGVIDVGAARWANKNGSTVGPITAANAITGSSASDGNNLYITPLTNGHYVVVFRLWDNGAVADVGAVRWGDKDGKTLGPTTAANSIIGTSANDGSTMIVHPLPNGNYAVTFFQWDDGATADVGAVTWANGSQPTSRVISAANSLIGSTTGDRVGEQLTPLPNGNYIIRSSLWDNGGTPDVGAITWVDGKNPISGVINASNSLIGARSGDRVGSDAPILLTNGHYLISAKNWDSPTLSNVGAMVWCDSTAPCTGVVSESTALIGSSTDDFQAFQVILYNNGAYLIDLFWWNNGATEDAGAFFYSEGTRPITGQVSAANALVSETAGNKRVIVLPNYSVILSIPGWSTNILSPTGNGAIFYIEPPQNYLANASFETAGSASKFASNWKGAGLTTGDKRLCGKPNKPILRTDGACVFQFSTTSTPAKARTVKQAFQNPAWATVGSTLTLTADVEGVKVGTGAKKIILNIKYDNNTTDKATLTIPNGTYDYTPLIGTVKLTRPVKTVTVTINVGKAKGRIRVDNLYLGASSSAPLRFPMLGENTTRDGASPFTSPAAPEGFRH